MQKPLTDRQKKMIRSKRDKLLPEQLARELKVDVRQIEAYLGGLRPALDPRKRRLFTAALVAIPILFFVLLELGLRLFGYGGDLRLFIPAPDEVSQYYLINRDVARRYFFMQNTVPRPTKDLFLREKPRNSYRIFVLGGSTTAGFPYGNNLTFSRILDRRLAETFPDLRIEVVNVSMAAISSYTLLDFTDEILAQKPDLLIIYAGHNEFYGAMGVGSMESLGRNPAVARVFLRLGRYRLFLLMREFAGGIRKTTTRAVHGATEDDPTATLMARIVAEQTIPLDSPLYHKGKEQFRRNLTAILEKSQRAGVPVLVSELVSNVRDQKPFVSEKTGSHPPAGAVYAQAQMLEQAGQIEAARSAFYRAKDLDALRFRATEEFNAILHEVAQAKQIPVIRMKYYFEQASRNGLIGDLLMSDHLHPNVTGYFLMAEAFYRTMRQYGAIIDTWPQDEPRPLAEMMKGWGVTALDTVYAELGIRYLKGGWPFQPMAGPNRSLDDYVPGNPVESMALEAVTRPDLSIEAAHLELAELYQKQGDPARALEEYKALCHMIPFETLFHERAAQILISEKRFEEAIPYLESSLRVRETYFAQKWIGQLLLAQADFYRALPHLERAVRIQGPDEQLLYNLARAYLAVSRIKSAESIVSRLAALNPESRYLPALQAYHAESKVNIERIDVLLKEAHGYLGNGNLRKAEYLLLEAVRIQDNRTAHEWLSRIYIDKKDAGKAAAHYEKSLYYTPEDPERLYQMAVLYSRIGRPFKARELLFRLEEVHPRFEDPFQLKRLL